MMTDQQIPPDWVLIEAAKRSGWGDVPLDILEKSYCRSPTSFRALCDIIQKYEQPPVDRKVLCAHEAMAMGYELMGFNDVANNLRNGDYDEGEAVQDCIRAIELWEEGFGK